jgi:hypothetical protein
MRRSVSPFLAAVLLLGLGGRVRGQEAEARALIDRAIAAQGGLAKLSREVASRRKIKGVFHGDRFTFTGATFSEPGKRLRIELDGTIKNGPASVILVYNGTRGWASYNGSTRELDEAAMERHRRASYADRVSGLVTLVKDKGYKLTLLGESIIKGKPAVGLRVEKAGKPDVLLYFDKQSGLLVKSSNRVQDPDKRREVEQVLYYFDYRVHDPAAADERTLRAAKLGVDGPALLALLRKRIPTEAEQVKLKDLVLKLGHRSFGVRQRASAELKSWGLKAAPLLRQAARDPDHEVARRAKQALEALAHDPDAALVAAAARLLAQRRPPGAAAVLLDYFPWAPDEAVAREVQGALAAIVDAGGKNDSALLSALRDRDPQRRATAAAALGKDGGVYRKQGWRRIFVDAVRVATRIESLRDGERYMDLETTGEEFFNRLEDSLFGRP